MPMPTLSVIRHSMAQANEQGILMGAKFDSPLSLKGIEIAKAKGEYFKKNGFKPDRIFTSKLTRAKQTAEIILNELGIATEIVELEDLNERDFGQYDGKPYNFVLDAFAAHGENPPTIETIEHFVSRVMKAFEYIKQETIGTTLAVTHSNPEMVMQTAVFRPGNIQRFWELGDPAYCEGFDFSLPFKNDDHDKDAPHL